MPDFPPEKGVDFRKLERKVPTVSASFPDGSVIEMIYNRIREQSAFVRWKSGVWEIHDTVPVDPLLRLVPYSAQNNLIKNQIVLLPTGPEEYDSEQALVDEIRCFIHRYVDLSPVFEQIAAFYVLFTWVHDQFNELPYLRARGEPGCGKTRFLLTVGSLCYKPIFASGASTTSPLFRILDSIGGTLIIDESDFRMSDEKNELSKILNNGNAKGFPVLRSEGNGKGEYNPRAYQVFGPKLVAVRRSFEDRALESRFLTEDMGQHTMREDIPINLPASHAAEALALRNKLLLFRFRNLGKSNISEDLIDRRIEPRLNQVFAPLLSIIDDSDLRASLRNVLREHHQDMVAERGLDTEAEILAIIRDIAGERENPRLSVGEITQRFSELHGEDYDRKITQRWIGGVLRSRLHVKTRKSHGLFVIPPDECPKLKRLYDRYGIEKLHDA